jgi:hypothetical protein
MRQNCYTMHTFPNLFLMPSTCSVANVLRHLLSIKEEVTMAYFRIILIPYILYCLFNGAFSSSVYIVS